MIDHEKVNKKTFVLYIRMNDLATSQTTVLRIQKSWYFSLVSNEISWMSSPFCEVDQRKIKELEDKYAQFHSEFAIDWESLIAKWFCPQWSFVWCCYYSFDRFWILLAYPMTTRIVNSTNKRDQWANHLSVENATKDIRGNLILYTNPNTMGMKCIANCQILFICFGM